MRQGKQPVDVTRIRRNIANFGDPYLTDESFEENTVCSECGSVVIGNRWYLKNQADQHKPSTHDIHYTVCPACKKIHDKAPGGIVHLSGLFLREHKDDILNLVRNESDRAMTINPLERIIDIETEDSTLAILTTNERLAQRLGKALNRAYDGNISYKWSTDNKLVRVDWHRD